MKSTEIRDAALGSAVRPSRISALAKFSLSKLRTHVVSNLLYSSTQNCTKTIHSRTTTSTTTRPLHTQMTYWTYGGMFPFILQNRVESGLNVFM